MPHDVIMPALGMAQDTGLLVAWRKAPGEAVAAGEPLFEVETDKATMEVEAAAAGFLSSVSVAEGTDVPVGQVIARIVESRDEVDATPPPAAGKAGAAKVGHEAAPTPAQDRTLPQPPREAEAPVAAPRPVPGAGPALTPAASALPPRSDALRDISHEGAGRILASPKARRLAAEEGLDLSRLVRAGHPQPYHAADLDRLRALAAPGRAMLSARARGSALTVLLGKAAPGTDAARVHAAFAAGAWRHVFGQDAPSMSILRPDGMREGEGKLVLVDLTGTRLAGYASQDGLVLSLAREGEDFVLILGFDEATLAFAGAVAWLNELVARIEDPIRQLV